MIVRHLSAIVGVSSFCFGIWFDRKYRQFTASNSNKLPILQIFDAVKADSIITNDQQLTLNNEQRVSQVR